METVYNEEISREFPRKTSITKLSRKTIARIFSEVSYIYVFPEKYYSTKFQSLSCSFPQKLSQKKLVQARNVGASYYDDTVFCRSAKSFIIPGCAQGANIYLVCLRVSVCVTMVDFNEHGSCTRPSSTNPGSMEAGKHGLTRETWFFARRLEVVAVAWLR